MASQPETDLSSAAARIAYLSGQEAERKRIAREIHDSLTQTFHILILTAARVEAEIPPSARGARAAMGDFCVTLREFAADLHDVAIWLHPSVVERSGLRRGLEGLCADFRRRGDLDVDFVGAECPEPLPTAVSLCLYRIAQEALRNVQRHAQVKQALVMLCLGDGSLTLTIEDQGIGFDVGAATRETALGLIGMQERVSLIGGRLTIDSAAGKGTRIVAQVPFR